MSQEPEPAPAGATVEFCYRHPHEETRVHCTRCGRPICTECMIPAPVGHQCPECVNEARRAFRVGPQQRARQLAGLSVTRLLLISIAAVFVLEIVLSHGAILRAGFVGGGQEVNQTLLDMGALFPPAVALGHQYWRLLTVMFLHASLLHIALNAWALYLFGQFVEGSFGRGRLLLIYFVSGFTASVASYAFGYVGEVGVGASGAIVGLLGAFLAYNLRRRHLATAQTNLRWALMIIGVNLVFGLSVGHVDNWAHGGGLVGGFAGGLLVEGFGPRRYRPAVKILGFALLIGVGIAITAWRTSYLQAHLPAQLGG